MSRQVAAALSDREVRAAGPGRYADGGGLYLIVKESGARSWLLRYKGEGGRVRDMGLGRAPGGKAGAPPTSRLPSIHKRRSAC